MTQEDIWAQLAGQFGDFVAPLSETKGDRFTLVKGEKIVEVCQFLRNTAGLELDYCQDITAVDWPARKVIEVVYHLYSLPHRHGLVLKVEANRDQPVVPTVEGVWKAASWLEREIYDLFGVSFTGHSDLRRILMPDDWVGHPLRKDYQEAGGYHGIGNERPDPLVQLTKVTEEKRKAVAAAFAASAPAPAAPAEGAPAATTSTATATTTTTTKSTTTATITTTLATRTTTTTTSAPPTSTSSPTRSPRCSPSSPSSPGARWAGPGWTRSWGSSARW